MNPNFLRKLAISSFENAAELLEEATLLYKNGHYARALFLAQIGGEELGKHIMCTSAYVQFHRKEKFNEKKFKEKFRKHKIKTLNISVFEDFFGDLFNQRELSDKDFLKRFSKYKPDVDMLEIVKLASLYVDISGDKISTPSKIITDEYANQSLGLLKNRVALFNKLGTLKILRNKKVSELVLLKTLEILEAMEKLKN